MMLPLMHYLQLIANNRWVRHLLSVIMLLTLAAIIGTYSRGALLALSTMGFFMWLRSSKKLPVAVAAVVCIVGVLSFMPQHWFDRMNTINSYEEDESASGRFDAWLFAINVAKDRVVGGGFKVNTNAELWPIYNPESPIVRAPHSIYFEVLGEHGWIGLTIFLTLGAAAFLTCSMVNKRSRDRPDLKWAADLAKMLQVSLVGYAVAGAFLNLATFDLYYHVLAIIVQTRLCVQRALTQGPPVQAAAAAEQTPGAEAGEATALAREDVEAKGATGARDVPAGHKLGGASGYLIQRR